MRRLILCLAAGCAALVLSAGAAPAKSPKGTLCVLHAKLSAKSETTGSTSVAKGHTTIKVRTDGTIEFKTKILNKAHETFVAGHIHQAPVGVAGGIVVPLFGAPSAPTSARQIKQHGVATPNAGTTGAALCANPSAYYVNYHTTAFPGGAIRGQLH
jgi:Cu/Zn superoxide dismutase